MKCIISCEHASNRVPPRFAHLFQGKERILSSHQAYDPGAANMARKLSAQLQASLYLGTISRLLIDLNRSPTNRKTLYTPLSRKLALGERELLLQKYYYPYRKMVEGEVGSITGKERPVLHISLHSFSPVKDGRVRKADIGLLYDPARRSEKIICSYTAALLQEKMASLLVRRNYPYQGKTDGFTSFMRRKYPAKLYAGIEIELNQELLSPGNRKRKTIEEVLGDALSNIMKLHDFSRLKKIL